MTSHDRCHPRGTVPGHRSQRNRDKRTPFGGGRSQKLQCPLDEVLVELEHPAVPGVGVDDELAVRESSIEVDGVLGGHHPVALTVRDEHRLVDAREIGGLLLTPSVAGLELGAERAYGDGLVAVVRTFLEPCQELLPGTAAV